MRLRSAIAAAVLMSAGITFGETVISIGPPEPLDTRSVVATVYQACASGCAYDCDAFADWTSSTDYGIVRISGIWGDWCPTWCVHLHREFELGVLPVGDYEIRVDWVWYDDPSMTCSGHPLLPESFVTEFHVHSACDMDQDTDVDLVDSAEFGECLSGPTSRLDGLCARGDADGDDDIDLKDYAVLQRVFTG